MPRPDPTPAPSGSVKRRFWRIFRLLAPLSVVIAAIAVILVARGPGPMPIHLVVATALGVGFTVLLGSSLMALMFLSSRSGADDAAAPRLHDEDKQE